MTAPLDRSYRAMPPPAPLLMPVQDLRRAPARRPSSSANARTVIARLVAFGGALLLTALGTWEMRDLMGVDALDPLSLAFLVLFALTFGWIAFSATSALAGLLWRRRAPVPAPGEGDVGPTALVMPVYHEDPHETTARLEAIARDLERAGGAGEFEIVVISDTTDPDAWVRETAAVDRLARALRGTIAVHYRRRTDNTGKKAGNVADFVRRWGARYPHMVVLDADSVMGGETLLALRRRMIAEPDLGLLQTVPRLVGARTPFAMMQEFAGSLYGPVAARGVAVWSGADGNFWGHNAIIRTRAFAGCCGLPELRGRAPFGGHVLSHDFVEAALLRRIGWRVEMDPDLDGSYEEGPPTLLDAAARDRRWAQGNLQHAGILPARGLAWLSRAHMLIGIGSYLASPLWLLSILVGLAVALRARLDVPDYFPDPYQLHPTWPSFDPVRMGWLLAITLGLALVPKLIGLARGLLMPTVRQAHGGAGTLLRGAAAEAVLAVLLAPVVMALQTRDIAAILLFGRASAWAPQRRRADEAAWRSLVRPLLWPVLLGVAIGLGAAFVSLAMFLWLSPFVLGLVLAVPLAAWTGSERIGQGLAGRGVLRSAEANDIPRPVVEAMAIAGCNVQRPLPTGLSDLIADPDARATHFRWVEAPVAQRGVPLTERLTAAEKLREAMSADEGLRWLTPRERMQVAIDPALSERLAALDRSEAA